MIRLAPTEIRTMGRQAKGVRLIRLDEGQVLATIVAFEETPGENEPDDSEGGDSSGIQAAVKALPFDNEEDAIYLASDAPDEDTLDEDSYNDEYLV